MAKQTSKQVSIIEVPEHSLAHLRRLTDDTGLFQHANLTVPDRKQGYCTDDNARAVVAMVKYYAQYAEPEAIELLDRYLSFILYAQQEDGTVRNFLNFDRTWQSNESPSDALGRFLWGLGAVIAQPPSPSYLPIVKDYFDRSVPHIKLEHPREMAYSILGMSDYLKQFPGASDIKRQLSLATDGLMELYLKNTFADWCWFEPVLTYDNAILSYALFVAGLTFEDERYIEAGRKTSEFLLANIFTGSHFSFVGCDGWFPRGGEKARFDQQPIEAASTVMMLRAGYDATENSRFLVLQRKAFEWFLGENDLRMPVYDFHTKGCHDGLGQDGVNANQGAESMLSFLLSLLAIVESYSIVDKLAEDSRALRELEICASQGISDAHKPKAIPIDNVTGGNAIAQSKIEELA